MIKKNERRPKKVIRNEKRHKIVTHKQFFKIRIYQQFYINRVEKYMDNFYRKI